MSVLAHHVLLAASVAALGSAGLRAASLAVPRGLLRAIAAVTIAAAAAMVHALLLGLFGLGGSEVALAAAAAATWLAARLALPRPRLGPARELSGWWGRLRPVERLALGALCGAGVAWTAWLLRYPALGYDSFFYHLAEPVVWVRDGTPGSVEPVSGLPVGSYPLAYEVLTAWGLALARSFVPATLIVPAHTLLLVVSGWACLRELRVPRGPAALAVGAVVGCPAAIALGRSGATLDPGSVAWLAACAALCAGSVRRPALLAPALVAGGLAIGTKTTALPLTALVLSLGVIANRRNLRPLAAPLLLSLGAAAAVGLFWYARNTVEHGSPFWPFLALPWGDPAPPVIAAADISFLDRPGETLRRIGDSYIDQFAGGLVLLAASLAAPLLVRRRDVLVGALATGASLLLWLNAPLTGVSDNPGFDAGTADAVRYLLPGLAAAALTLALAARARGGGALFATAALALALVLHAVNTLDLGFPASPSIATPAIGAAAGALATALLGAAANRRARPMPRLAEGWGTAATAVAAVAAGCALSPLAGGYLGRHADTNQFDSGLTAWFDARRDDLRPVAITGGVHALVAGERLQRRLHFIPARESCARVERRRRDSWVVVTELLRRRVQADARDCLRGERPAYEDATYRIFAPRGSS